MAGIRSHVTWFWHEDKALDEAVERGDTDVEIARALGRSVGSIAGRRYARGLFRIRRYAKRHCRDCGAKCSRSDATRCLSCHHKAQRADILKNSSFFSMVSAEEILEGGVRRRLYGDLRGL